MRKLTVTVSLILLFSPGAFAQTSKDRPLIKVTGEADVLVVPDEVVFDLAVQTINRSLPLAKEQNDERIKKILTLSAKYGIASKDVQTNYFKVGQRFRGREESRIFVGYVVRKDIVMTLRDISRVEAVIADILDAGISEVNGVRFETTEIRKYKDEARARAIRAAREKASALAGEIGQKIGKAYSITEGSGSSGFRIDGQDSNDNYVVPSSSDGITTQNTIALGQIKITASVTVEFELN